MRPLSLPRSNNGNHNKMPAFFLAMTTAQVYRGFDESIRSNSINSSISFMHSPDLFGAIFYKKQLYISL